MRHLLLIALLSCAAPRHADRPAVDCTAADQGRIGTLLGLFERALFNGASWGAVEQEAIAAGMTYGGCALASLVQRYLTPAPGRAAPSPNNGRAARDTLERFRLEHAGGAVFHTAEADL